VIRRWKDPQSSLTEFLKIVDERKRKAETEDEED